MARQYNYEQKPGETLNQLYNRLAKVSDMRLERLEELSKEEGFKTAKEWAYRRAEKDIAKYSGGKPGAAPRFNRKPANEAEMKAKIRDMQTFLASPTSTKSGIVSVYKKRADTINEKYGTNWTWEDVAKYFLKAQNVKYEKIATSKTILVAIGKIQQAEKDYDMTYTEMKKMAWQATGKNATRADLRIDKEDPIMDQTIKKLLRTVSLKEYL